MKFGLYTLGCKVNQYETQAMEQILRAMGHEVLPFEAATATSSTPVPSPLWQIRKTAQ